jgi:hypothetical protein
VNRDSSVGIVLGYRLDNRGSRVRFPAGVRIFLCTTASRTALGSTKPPTQWVPGAPSMGVKRPGREADHSPPSSAGGPNLMNSILVSVVSKYLNSATFSKDLLTIFIL